MFQGKFYQPSSGTPMGPTSSLAVAYAFIRIFQA